MPRITQRICGVCPTAHHMASTRALDDLYHVDPPPAAHKLRELFYNLFMFEDHTLHFYFLGGPDFIVGPDRAGGRSGTSSASSARWVWRSAARSSRRAKLAREFMAEMAGKVIHPVFGLPGGVSKPLKADMGDAPQGDCAAAAWTSPSSRCRPSTTSCSGTRRYVDMILADYYAHKTNYMGMVDANEKDHFLPRRPARHRPDGQASRAVPAARLPGVHRRARRAVVVHQVPVPEDAGLEGVRGRRGQRRSTAWRRSRGSTSRTAWPRRWRRPHYERVLQSRWAASRSTAPSPTHWARLIEALQATETIQALANDPEILSPDVRKLPETAPTEGIGIVEAPRGTLIHHYTTDPNGILTMVNLIVATVHNSAPIQMSIEKAAKGVIHGGKVDDGLLNMVEMAFRAYDPVLRLRHALAARRDAVARDDPRCPGRVCRWWNVVEAGCVTGIRDSELGKKRCTQTTAVRRTDCVTSGTASWCCASATTSCAMTVSVGRRRRPRGTCAEPESRPSVVVVKRSALSGFYLLDELTGWNRAIVVDAVQTGLHPPGTVLSFPFEALGTEAGPSPHAVGLPTVVRLGRQSGVPLPASIHIVAVEVDDMESFVRGPDAGRPGGGAGRG